MASFSRPNQRHCIVTCNSCVHSLQITPPSQSRDLSLRLCMLSHCFFHHFSAFFCPDCWSSNHSHGICFLHQDF
ncbi:unnamed protein product [Chondrus crispus]|uniref:Uncharacterized protein n=1 Tax=Chondrus crispus TaxID=2769 RepID=R7QH04_CHOCR|nr:unnamed protein product [Chondrus crispus]CDF36751.1 unnamed protein product [Chondrus crispus]|eukprot:XP_005716570.1 unnamed protein product [Chondrus crispus]